MVENDVLEEKILELVESKHPSTSSELVELMSTELNISKKDSINLLLILEDKGKIFFRDKNSKIPSPFISYLLSPHIFWYWKIIIISIVTIFTSLGFLKENLIFNYARYIFGSIYLMYLPGYCIFKNLYIYEDIDKIKESVLSIGISVSVVSIIGIILNYTPWGISIEPILILNTILILFLSTIALKREYDYKITTYK
jgi:hypothetical protein